MNKGIFLLALILGISINEVFGQFFENRFFKDSTNAFSSNSLTFSLDNAIFFRNNEYFGKIVEGYTLPGTWIQPKISYYVNENSKITAGAHFLSFFGDKGFYKIEPYFSFQQSISKNLKMTLGALDIKDGHYLPAPLFDPERFYLNQVNNGLQFQYTNGSRFSDIWLSWDRFIFYGDTVQEQLTAGISNNINLVNSDNLELNLPFFALFTHQGGQINRPKDTIETLVNAGAGITLKYNISGSVLNAIEFSPEVYFYKKNNNSPTRVFNDGWALFPSITVYLNHFYIKNSFWYSKKFIGPRGEMIYQSVSNIPGTIFTLKERSMNVTKIGYWKQLGKGLHLSANFESYYDIPEKQFDYNFSVNVSFSGEWLVKQLK